MSRKCSKEGKTIFNSKWLAEVFVERRSTDVKLRIYDCDVCGGYHVTKKLLKPVTCKLVHADEFKKYLNNQ